jgi:phosphoribosyl 1,2-cyclic phosphodiesterase
MKICSLSSGSKGNALFIESTYCRILIDAGISGLKIQTGLQSIGIDPSSIDGIILTHAHADHVRGAGVFSRKFKTPIYGHPETLDSISHYLTRFEKIIPWKSSFQVKDLIFTPFPLSHDAIPTVGYLITDLQHTFAICTDLGVVTDTVIENLKQAGTLILESNHDPELLLNGPYPWELKERISSRVGHLSNHDTGKLLQTILKGQVSNVFLAHLSEENNTPELALQTVTEYIGVGFVDRIEIFAQGKVSKIFDIT